MSEDIILETTPPADPGPPPTAAADDGGDDWCYPAAPDTQPIADGRYAGRTAVGKPGSMERIVPRIMPQLRGGHRPEIMVDAGLAGDRLQVGAVSLRGPAHHQYGQPRQDYYALGIEDDWFIGAIADGVSEGKLSHLAAERAVHTAIAEVRRVVGDSVPTEDQWSAIAEACRQHVRALALQLLGPYLKGPDGEAVDPDTVSDVTLARHTATTCDIIICRLTPDDDGSIPALRATVAGDGSSYLLDPERGWLQVGPGKSSRDGMVDNSVVPLPVSTGLPRLTPIRLSPGTALVLCTDGFGDVIKDGALPVGRYLFQEWSRPLDATGLLNTSTFVNINADDDRTAIIVWALP